MIASFERFELSMTKEQAHGASHQGRCDEDVDALLNMPAIKRQLAKIPPADIRAELKAHGAWDDAELDDAEANKARIVWIAAGNIREDTVAAYARRHARCLSSAKGGLTMAIFDFGIRRVTKTWSSVWVQFHDRASVTFVNGTRMYVYDPHRED